MIRLRSLILLVCLLVALPGLTPAQQTVAMAPIKVADHVYYVQGIAGVATDNQGFVSNAAFNALGRPAWSTLTNWVRDGLLTLPLALLMAGWFGGSGVIYAQAAVNVLVGAVAAYWGWRYVIHLGRQQLPALDLEPARPYAHADRFRRR